MYTECMRALWQPNTKVRIASARVRSSPPSWTVWNDVVVAVVLVVMPVRTRIKCTHIHMQKKKMCCAINCNHLGSSCAWCPDTPAHQYVQAFVCFGLRFFLCLCISLLGCFHVIEIDFLRIHNSICFSKIDIGPLNNKKLRRKSSNLKLDQHKRKWTK